MGKESIAILFRRYNIPSDFQIQTNISSLVHRHEQSSRQTVAGERETPLPPFVVDLQNEKHIDGGLWYLSISRGRRQMLSRHFIDAMKRLLEKNPTLKPRYCRDTIVKHVAIVVILQPFNFLDPGTTASQDQCIKVKLKKNSKAEAIVLADVS